VKKKKLQATRATALADSEDLVRIGALGGAGSFSEEAARAYAERERITYEIANKSDFDDVLVALDENRLDLGILPVSNTVGGLVRGSFEAMGRYSFQPIGQIALDIHHSLMVRSPEVRPRDVERVVSHPQAIAQCSGYLSRELPGCEWMEWSDTASAARDLSQGRLDAGVAVIASVRAAEIYRLHVLAADIQDDPKNETRFVVIRRLPS
jgi:prephenate dehydratase